MAYEAYEWVRGRVKGTAGPAFQHAKQIIHLERLLGLYQELRMQRWVLPHLRLVQAADIYYGTVHFIVPVVAFVLLWRRAPERYSRWRNTVVAMTVLAIFGFAFYPLMPPRLLPLATYHFVDTAAHQGGMGVFDKGSMKDVENLYAAMPSLHIGWSSWCAFALVPLLRRWWSKALAALYPCVTLFVIAVTANHYLLDGAGGLLFLGLGYGVARGGEALWARWRRAPAPTPAPQAA